jgi:hypothetical protein
MGFSREAHRMLIGSTVPRLTHILKSVPKEQASTKWMQSADDAHLSAWRRCVGAEQLDAALQALGRAHLAASLDLPPQFGGVGLQSLIRDDADEELLGSWAAVTANLITLCRSKGLSSYSHISDALDSMVDSPPTPMDEDHAPPLHPAIDAMMTFSMRSHAFLGTIHPQGGGGLLPYTNHGGADRGNPGSLHSVGSTHKTRRDCAS